MGLFVLTLDIQHLLTFAYYPQSDVVVKRFHRQLKDMLRVRLDQAPAVSVARPPSKTKVGQQPTLS